MIQNGWQLFHFRLFKAALDELEQAVAKLAKRDPDGYKSHPKTRLLASVYKAIIQTVPVNPDHAGKWFDGSGHDLQELLALVDAGKPLPRFPLVPTLRAKVKVERRNLESQNVAAIRPGTDPVLKNEYVVLTAPRP